MTRSTILTVIVSVVFLFCVATTQGALYTLIDDNSTAIIDDGSSAGVGTWTIDGTDHMFQQWFWYRIGNTAEASIDTLAFIVGGVTDTNLDGDDDTLYLRYANDQAASQYTVEVRFILNGGPAGSGLSAIAEQMSLTHLRTSPLDLTFSRFSASTLRTSQLTKAKSVRQSGPDWTVYETGSTEAADALELDIFAITRTNRNDGVATTLGNALAAGPVGPGNVTWAFQWDRIIPVGGAFLISKDKSMVPEPATLFVMLAAGLPMLLRHRRSRG